MRTTRYSRNPRIARTLVEFGWVRELNEGVKRIYTEMQDSLLNDPVYTEPGGTRVQLTLENQHRGADRQEERSARGQAFS